MKWSRIRMTINFALTVVTLLASRKKYVDHLDNVGNAQKREIKLKSLLLSKHLAVKGVLGSGGIVLCILNIDSKWR